MKTYSKLLHRTPATSDRLVAKIQPRSVDDQTLDRPLVPPHDFSHVDLFAHAPQNRLPAQVQMKPAVGAPQGQHEQEGDRAAQQVMTMPNAAKSVQRQEAPLHDLVQCKGGHGKKHQGERRQRAWDYEEKPKGDKHQKKQNLRQEIDEAYDDFLSDEFGEDELEEQDDLEGIEEAHDNWQAEEQDDLEEQEIEPDDGAKEKEEKAEKEKAEREKAEREKAEREKAESGFLNILKNFYNALVENMATDEQAIAAAQYEITRKALNSLFSLDSNVTALLDIAQGLVNGFERRVQEKIKVAKAEKEKAKQEKEHELEENWKLAAAKTYGEQAQQAAQQNFQAKVTEAENKVKQEQDKKPEGGSSKDQRKWTQNQRSVIDASKRDLEKVKGESLDLDSVKQGASQEWLSDLQALRSAELSRVTIDALITQLGSSQIHKLLQSNGAAASLALLSQNLTPAQVKDVLIATNWTVSNKLTAQIASAFSGLLNHGGTGKLCVQSWSSLGDGLVTLLEQSQSLGSCVKLLGCNSKNLGLMVEAGQSALLAELVQHVDVKWVDFLLSNVLSSKELNALCANKQNLASVFNAGVPESQLKNWCQTQISPFTDLLNRTDLPDCRPMLTGFNLSPKELMAPLTQGASAAVVASAVLKAQDLLQEPQQALEYFCLHPGHSLENYSQSVASAAAYKASLDPTRIKKMSPGGKPYTALEHQAELDSNVLEMLLREGYARIKYVATFKTITEKDLGGDTEEYDIETWDGNNWKTLWVVHLHRKKGDSKTAAPAAMHLKRKDQSKDKEVKRILISTALAAECRKKNTEK